MSENEPSAGDGPADPQPASSRFRDLLRRVRRRRGPREPIEAVIAAATAEGEPITPQERVLIANVFKVHDRTAADAMVPRVDIIALDVEQPFADVVRCMIEHGHSRLPIYRETLDLSLIHI